MYDAQTDPVRTEPTLDTLCADHDALVAEQSRLRQAGAPVPPEMRARLDALQAEISERIFDNMPV